jgi:hypothetical protein
MGKERTKGRNVVAENTSKADMLKEKNGMQER